MRESTRQMALAGMLAALAVVILCLGTVVPLMTYAAPLLAIVVLQVVRLYCSRKLSWTWYVAVSLLAALLCPDREAAAVFAAFGYYPLLRPMLETVRPKFLRNLVKFLLFQLSIGAVALMVIALFGLEALLEGSDAASWALLGAFWVLTNVCLFMADRMLALLEMRMGRR